MTGFPKPPVGNRQQPPGPMPEKRESVDVEIPAALSLTEDETAFILRQYLTPLQYDDPRVIKFILSYCECRNAAQAARDAGMNGKGNYLKQKPEIFRSIQAITEKAMMKYGYDAAEIVERVKEVSEIDLIEFENPDGSYKTHLSQIRPEARRAIKRLKVKNMWGKDPNGLPQVIGQIIDIEVWDKLKAAELLGREKHTFKETKRVEHDVTTNMKDILLESKRRADQRVLGEAPVSEEAKGAYRLMSPPDIETEVIEVKDDGT